MWETDKLLWMKPFTVAFKVTLEIVPCDMRVEGVNGLEVLVPQFINNVPDEFDSAAFRCSVGVLVIDKDRVHCLHSDTYNQC